MSRLIHVSLTALMAFLIFGPLPASFLPRAVLAMPFYWAGWITESQHLAFTFLWNN